MNRLSARERLMAGIILCIVFVLGNMMLISSFLKRNAQIKSDLAAKQVELDSIKTICQDQDLCAARAATLAAKQPKLANRDQACVALLEEVKQMAKAQDVQIQSPELGGIESQPAYQAVTVRIETKSSWASLVKFLQTIQQPDRFIVLQSYNFKIESDDQTQMHGKFEIAKWYAP